MTIRKEKVTPHLYTFTFYLSVSFVLAISIVFLFFATQVVEAEVNNNNTYITNTITVSSSSGGNSTKDGVVKKGFQSTVIFSETIVNDEVVEYTEEIIESSEPIVFKKEVSVDEGSVVVVTSIELDAVTATEYQEPDTTAFESTDVATIKKEKDHVKSRLFGFVFNLFTYVFSFFA